MDKPRRNKAADPFYLTAEWRELRQQALRRDYFCCVVCGVGVRGKGELHALDHIQPRKQYPQPFSLSAIQCAHAVYVM